MTLVHLMHIELCYYFLWFYVSVGVCGFDLGCSLYKNQFFFDLVEA